MDFKAILSWLGQHWYFILLFLVTAVAAFLLLRLQVFLRSRSAAAIEELLRVNPALCAERLENNKRLRMIFRKPILYIWKMEAYMALGQDEKIQECIARLGKMKLEPNDKLEFYQKCISYYAVSCEPERAREYRDLLYGLLERAKALETEPYASILKEADMIIGVYVDHDVSLIKKLMGRASHTKNDVMRGVTQYRVAKLAYFKGDPELMETYLNRAAKNLKGTRYEPVIAAAMEEPGILAVK